jgi:uncharacterized Ntn-hydrolase superfamily protein
VFVGPYGAVATQGMVNTRLGHELSEALALSVTPKDAIERLLGRDELAHLRQVLAITPGGASACWNGSELPGWAGHLAQPGVIAAGNTLCSEETLASAVAAFGRATRGRGAPLLCALEAGQCAGGDRRGRQSACLLVGQGDAWGAVDLRVDDNPDPTAELRRLFSVWQQEWAVYDDTGSFPPARPPG